jgi:hypothetical protein
MFDRLFIKSIWPRVVKAPTGVNTITFGQIRRGPTPLARTQNQLSGDDVGFEKFGVVFEAARRAEAPARRNANRSDKPRLPA